jgi:hypothetical protein
MSVLAVRSRLCRWRNDGWDVSWCSVADRYKWGLLLALERRQEVGRAAAAKS